MDLKTNVADKQWFTNKQVASLFGFFIMMGIGYGEFRGVLGKQVLHDSQIQANKELVYQKARDGVDKTTRMVKPLRESIAKLEAESNYEKGYRDAMKAKP